MTPRIPPTQLHIAGQWRNATGDRRLPVVDPSTGKHIADVSDASVQDGLDAVTAAHRAAAAFARMPARERAEILRRCFELMLREKEYLAQLISFENGKSLTDARGEVAYAAEFFRWFSEEAVRLTGQLGTSPNGASRILVQYQPIGVSVLVTPWNFPAAMATRKIAPALAAGCTCVLKPAAETPLTAFALAELFAEAGVPDGVINIVTTSEPGPVVDAMLADKRVRKLSFTGSTQVGRTLLRSAAQQVISCSMELGGNAPFVVFDDADIDAAVEGAMVAKMRNGGEACTAANRFFVQRGVHDAFAARLAERMAAIPVGPGLDPHTGCGPMITAKAVDKIRTLVDDAVDRGARVLAGGHQPQGAGFFYMPTVLTGVSPDSRLLGEEIFGPVAPIVAFDTESEAIELANDTEYGLVAYVYTRDIARGLRVCEQIESGMVALNRGLVSDPAAPFGGVKQSGLGREGAHEGILEFSEMKYIAANW
ncbi:MAG: NAD-dependent succinate-semialdehyde dehydrogenase [Polaromonas sp.]|nr:NAD-dependent succinate-semialdehyde dehydrogenase [Polaromonas sp.]